MMTRPQNILREKTFCSLVIIIKNFISSTAGGLGRPIQFDIFFILASFWFLAATFLHQGILVEIYYSSNILNCFSILLLPKLCWHIGLTLIKFAISLQFLLRVQIYLKDKQSYSYVHIAMYIQLYAYEFSLNGIF